MANASFPKLDGLLSESERSSQLTSWILHPKERRGAGTGMCGELLKSAGYINMTAIDLSVSMLEQAKKKGIYKAVVQKDLNEDSLDEFEGQFNAVICIGVFYPG
ncbi:Methyltransferase type 11 [Oopsacas minuta]|uniref:Methyltransferase type 11 n=1 Tax=Oopsacas minuta TaxID=111878 RepID=A0AAV7JFC0_9METZ|nr:Methyltransferase type 11 [Oopsacas minuta]